VGEFSVGSYFTDHCIGNGKSADFAIGNFQDQVAETWSEEVSRIQIMLDLHAEAVSKGHLGYSGCNTVTVKGVRGKYIALLHILVNFAVLLHDPRIIRKIICVSGGSQPYKFA